MVFGMTALGGCVGCYKQIRRIYEKNTFNVQDFYRLSTLIIIIVVCYYIVSGVILLYQDICNSRCQ